MATSGRMSLYEQWAKASPLGAKPVYEDKYSDQMQDLYKQISGRGPFQYDATKDPLFQSYKDNYVRQGKLAMKDTMGQAAALTGGYGNTYGQQVGQQAYDAYLQNLGDVIPQLYGMAFDQYKDQGDQLLQQYGLLGDMRDRDYGLYRDAVGDWQNNAEFLRALESDEYNRDFNERQFAYQQSRDAWSQSMEQQRFTYQQMQDALDRQRQAEQDEYNRQKYAEQWSHEMDQWEYQKDQDAYSRAWNEEARDYSRQQDEQDRQRQAYSTLASLIQSSGYYPSNAELEAAGMSREAANALANEYNRGIDMDERNMAMREWSTYNSGSVGGGGGGRSSGGGGGYIVDVDPYTGTFSYGGDIYHDSLDYATDFGSSAAMNDLSSLWTSGAISRDQYALGAAGVASAGIRDYTNTLNQLANNKKIEKNTGKVFSGKRG